MFTKEPSSATRLASLLHKLQFFVRFDVPLNVARYAVTASKLIAANHGAAKEQISRSQSQDVTQVMSFDGTMRIRRVPRLDIVPQVDANYMLYKVVTSGAVIGHFDNLWRDVIVMKPWLPLGLQLEILKRANCFKADPLSACLRICLAQGRYIGSFQLCQLMPPDLPRFSNGVAFSSVALPIVSTGIISTFIWLSSPFVASMLALFWTGLLKSISDGVTPELDHVQFDFRKTTWWYRARNFRRLRMANTIMASFHEKGSLNAANFHRNPKRIDAAMELHDAITIELRQLYMVAKVPQSQLIYADYWSTDQSRWLGVKWHEPDQDPAESIFDYQLGEQKK